MKLVHRRDHVGASLWRGEHMIGGICVLFSLRGPRAECYPRFHAALDWRGRLWSYFSRGG